MVTKILAVAATMLAVGCVSMGNYDRLSQREQASFQRCRVTMQNAAGIDPNGDMFVATDHARGLAAQYSAEPTPEARRAWLVANGCPPHMVEPERYVSADPVAVPVK